MLKATCITAAIVLGTGAIANGTFMLIDPERWYLNVPGVMTTGPFNQHFVRDIGLIFLLLGGSFLLGVARPHFRVTFWAAPSIWLAGHALFHFWEVVVGICGPSALVRDFLAVTLPAIVGLSITLWATTNARSESNAIYSELIAERSRHTGRRGMDDSDEHRRRRPADAEMARVLNTKPLNIVSGRNLSGGGLAHWKHGALHDVVQPMADHVIMTYIDTLQPLERRTGRSTATGVARPGVVTIITAGTSARWDIAGAVDVVQLYLPQATIERVAVEAHNASPAELLERTGHLDPITARLLTTAAEALEGNTTLDTMFRQQLTDLLATRLLAAHAGKPVAPQLATGGLPPRLLRRVLERLRSESDADVSLAALAADAGLSRFHFCRAFKESTGMPPHAWLRQYRVEQAKTMLRDPSLSIIAVAIALGYGSQTAFAAAFKKLTGVSPSEFRRLAI